jgi:hypothetical protein
VFGYDRAPSRPQVYTHAVALGLSWAAQQLYRVFAGGLGDDHVVAADELRALVGVDVAVEDDDRQPGLDRLQRRRRQPADSFGEMIGTCGSQRR